MPGQPDWQLFQSSSAPYLYSEFGAAPVGKSSVYVGPWRTLFVVANDAGNGDVWDMLLTFANDAAITQVVQQIPIILGTGVAFVGFVPVLGPYLRIGVTNTVVAVGGSFTGSVLPMLLDPPTQGRYLPRSIINNVEIAENHNNFADTLPSYITAGPARLTIRATGVNVQFDLQSMASNGIWSTFARHQPRERNVAISYDLTLPYNPIRLRVTNLETFRQIVYDARLEPI
jgi:hypothetical protein